MTSDADALEHQLKTLLRGEFSSLTINFNDHHTNYRNAREAIEGEVEYNHTDWVSEEEKEKAAQNNSVWTIHWYPDTPVGFFSVSASTLNAALKGAGVKSEDESP